MEPVLNGFVAVWSLIYAMLQLVIIASIAISFLDAPPSNQIVQIIRGVTEPLYKPFRKISSKIPGPLDFAPMLLLLLLVFINAMLKSLLQN